MCLKIGQRGAFNLHDACFLLYQDNISVVQSWKIFLGLRASDKWEKILKKCMSDDAKSNELISLLQNVPGCEKAVLEDINEWLQNYVIDIIDNVIVAML